MCTTLTSDAGSARAATLQETPNRVDVISEDAGAYAGIVVHDRAGVLGGSGEDADAGEEGVVDDR